MFYLEHFKPKSKLIGKIFLMYLIWFCTKILGFVFVIIVMLFTFSVVKFVVNNGIEIIEFAFTKFFEAVGKLWNMIWGKKD